jgi:Concanavalin A-like lectin/glucanases superfamily
MRTRRTSLVVAALGAALLSGPAVATVASPASAAANDQGVSGTRSPMWQTNNNVEALAVANGVVYAGGYFTRVRPPGAAAGTSETARSYLAAFNASTGALVTSFNVTLNGAVLDLALSPDKKKLYIAGNFTTVNGTTRQRLAAINIPAGTLNTAFTANAGAGVTAVKASATTVWAGGDFGTIRGVAKARLASLNATTGALNTGFVADLDARANTIELAPDGSRLLVGGNFKTVNGAPPSGMASLNPATGAVQPWAANDTFPINSFCGGRVTDIVTQGTNAYVTAEGDPPGCYEGTYSAVISTGVMNWNSTCLGASQGLAILNNVLYKASHQHDCAFNEGGRMGGFVGGTSRDTFIWWRMVGQSLSDGGFVHWSPTTNSKTGSDPVGPHVIATDGTQLFVGGDFSTVDNQNQQGLIRYGTGDNTAPALPDPVTVRPTRPGALTVTWPATYDRDSGTITYRLYRDNVTNPVYTTTVESYPWTRPTMRFDDTGLAAGSSHSYRLSASDGTRTSSRSVAASATVRTAAPGSFEATVAGHDPELFWRLGQTDVTDSSSSGSATGTTVGGVTTGVPGAIDGDTAVTLDGSSGYLSSTEPLTLGTTFTESAWFKTTSIHGGSIVAMSSQAAGAGGVTDRAITMDNNGNIVAAVKGAGGGGGPFGPRQTTVRVQGPTFNDGRWHQVVSTYDGTALSLYIDGALLGSTVGTAGAGSTGGLTSGYQRVGYSDLAQNQAVFGRNFYHQLWPASTYFQGSVDEVATYPVALTAAQVAEQFAAAVADGA